MANLIITIISLAIFAIVAASAIYYGGQAFQNAQINATANAIMNEAQQILTAERMWSTNNNQPDISGMGTAGTPGTGMAMLVAGKELAEWPSFGGSMGISNSLTNPGPQPSTGNVTTGTYDYGCYSINGYYGSFIRTIFSYANANYVLYSFVINVPYSSPCNSINGYFYTSSTDISEINHPIVKVVKAINAAMNQIPANANLATMPYIGIPKPPSGSLRAPASAIYDASASFASNNRVWTDSNGTMQTNYCYLDPNTQSIECVFGPS